MTNKLLVVIYSICFCSVLVSAPDSGRRCAVSCGRTKLSFAAAVGVKCSRGDE